MTGIVAAISTYFLGPIVTGAIIGAIYGGAEGALQGAALGLAGAAIGGIVGNFWMMAAGAAYAISQEGLDGLVYFAAGVAGAIIGNRIAQGIGDSFTQGLQEVAQNNPHESVNQKNSPERISEIQESIVSKTVSNNSPKGQIEVKPISNAEAWRLKIQRALGLISESLKDFSFDGTRVGVGIGAGKSFRFGPVQVKAEASYLGVYEIPSGYHPEFNFAINAKVGGFNFRSGYNSGQGFQWGKPTGKFGQFSVNDFRTFEYGSTDPILAPAAIHYRFRVHLGPFE